MPTELPEIGAELVLRFNTLQREVLSLRQQQQSGAASATAQRQWEDERERLQRQFDDERTRFRQQLADVQTFADHQRTQSEESLRQAREDTQRLTDELTQTRQVLIATQHTERKLTDQLSAQRRDWDATRHTLSARIQELENEIRIATSKSPDAIMAAMAGPGSRTEITALQQMVTTLTRDNAALKQQLEKGTAERNGVADTAIPPQDLPRRHKELRKKLSTYSERLADLRGFETSIGPQLTTEQLKELVGALTKELTGMMERYQALSLWEKSRNADTR